MAGAVFGEVEVSLFVAGAVFGEIWNDSRSAKCCMHLCAAMTVCIKLEVSKEHVCPHAKGENNFHRR